MQVKMIERIPTKKVTKPSTRITAPNAIVNGSRSSEDAIIKAQNISATPANI